MILLLLLFLFFCVTVGVWVIFESSKVLYYFGYDILPVAGIVSGVLNVVQSIVIFCKYW